MRRGLRLAVGLLALCSVCQANTYRVVNTNDSGAGSLRQAITDANASAGHDNIEFQIPGAGPFIISPSPALPSISAPVRIDGSTQPGYSNQPVVWIDGTTNASAAGLWLSFTPNCTVRALGITRFSIGIYAWGGEGDLIAGCHIISNNSGIALLGTARSVIGGTNETDRNVLSGNGSSGLSVGASFGPGSENLIIGNYIGTDASGLHAMPNRDYGIIVGGGNNRIGGTNSTERNVISGNGSYGVDIAVSTASNTLIQGNYIGLSADGSNAVANQHHGIHLASDVVGTQIGGSQPGAGNVISGNGTVSGEAGIYLSGLNVAIQGNRIGTDSTGSRAVPNRVGIYNSRTANSTIGGTNPGEGNVISGNVEQGIYLSGESDFPCTNMLIAGNLIGVSADGASGIANGSDGIHLSDLSFATVGGTSTNARNVISGNGGHGLAIFNGATNINVWGNYIGLDATGSQNLGNTNSGILLDESIGIVRIGGAGAGERNCICGSQNDGITVNGDMSDVLIQGNYIGVGRDGTAPAGWPIQRQGICIAQGDGHAIGGTNSGEGNVISGHWFNGMEIRTSSNTIAGNLIGTDASGTQPVGNGFRGIWLRGLSGGPSADGNVIGGIATGAGNIIAWNGFWGITLSNGIHNSILGNSIHGHPRLGIDIGQDDVTPNDPGDADASVAQNYPVLTNAFAGSTHISGVLTSKASRAYRLEFFANPALHPMTNGEGQVFLGWTNVTTSASGIAPFAVVLERTSPTGWVVTATATDPEGSTSEFSPGQRVGAAPDMDANGIADFWEQRYFGHTIGAAATNDPDGDGVSTLHEYWADTHPTNRLDRLAIDSLTRVGGPQVGFQSSAGRSYQLQSCGALTGQWVDVGAEVSGAGGHMTLGDTNTVGPRYYQVRAHLP